MRWRCEKNNFLEADIYILQNITFFKYDMPISDFLFLFVLTECLATDSENVINIINTLIFDRVKTLVKNQIFGT